MLVVIVRVTEESVLTPVTGTEASRRAAEVAVAVARAAGRRIAALHVDNEAALAIAHLSQAAYEYFGPRR